MNTFTKATLALLTSSSIATSAFSATGSSDYSAYETYRNNISSVEALSNTLDAKGIEYNAEVNLEGANTFAKKAEVYSDKHQELQTIFNAAHFAN